MLYECQSMLNRLLLISLEVCLNLVLVNIRLLDYYQRAEILDSYRLLWIISKGPIIDTHLYPQYIDSIDRIDTNINL